VSALASAIVGRITPARAKQFEVTEKRALAPRPLRLVGSRCACCACCAVYVSCVCVHHADDCASLTRAGGFSAVCMCHVCVCVHHTYACALTRAGGFSADVELRRVAPPPDASGSSPTSPSRAARLSAEDGAPLLPLLPASPRCEPPCVTSPRANDTSGMVGVGTAPCTLAAVADNQAWWTLGTAATPCDVAAGDSTTRDAAAAGGLSAAQEAQLATSPKNSGTCALGAAAPLCAAVAADELARDSSQSDVIFHQLVLSAEMLLLVAGLLRRALAEPDGDADGAGGAGGAGGHHRWRELHDFHRWQQLGLVLVPAAWLLLNTIPNAMALACALSGPPRPPPPARARPFAPHRSSRSDTTGTPTCRTPTAYRAPPCSMRCAHRAHCSSSSPLRWYNL
jgi:hypothetical protein